MVLESNRCAQLDGLPVLVPCKLYWCHASHTGAMQAIINNYESLRQTMAISSHGMDDCSR